MWFANTMKPINRILEVMARHGLTQRSLAQAAGVEEARVNRWKNDRAQIFASHLHGLSLLLGRSMDYLWTGEEAPRMAARDEDDELVLEEMRRQHITHTEAIRRLRVPRDGSRQVVSPNHGASNDDVVADPNAGAVGKHTVGEAVSVDEAIHRLAGHPRRRPGKKHVNPKLGR